MYTQKYSELDSRMRLPENYSGNAILQNERVPLGTADIKKPSAELSQQADEGENKAERENKNPWENEESDTEATEVPASVTPSLFGKFKGIGGLFGKIPFGAFFEKKTDARGAWLGGLGIEEIMLIALAAVLLFSKNGDKECALILLLLLLID